MVKYNHLDTTFHALADSTRRHIIGMLVEQKQHRIKDLVEPFDMSFVAVSKHVKVLEKAGLVKRTQRGREHFVELKTGPLQEAQNWIEFYQKFWIERFASLEKLLTEDSTEKH